MSKTIFPLIELREDIEVQDLGHELMFYDPKSDRAHVLNPAAKFILSLCDGHHSIDEIANEIRSKFKVADDYNLHLDIISFIKDFKEKGLLKDLSKNG